MATSRKTVAIVGGGWKRSDDVTEPLARDGFDVRPFPISATALPADTVAVLVLVDSTPEAAAAFTRRCRLEAPTPRPVLWLFDLDAVRYAATGFDAGADVCLVRPVDANILVAQLNVLLRSYAELARGAPKGGNTFDLSERLAKLFRQTDADAALARRAVSAFTPTEPIIAEGWAADRVHAPAARGGVHTFGVRPDGDGLRVALATAVGLGSSTGSVLVEAVTRHLLTSNDSPAAALTDANRRVRELGLPDTSMLAATVGVLSGGTAVLACGGHPPPVFVPADAPASLWHGVGAFLGQSDAGYSDIRGEVGPGERLLLLAGGAAADKRPDVRAAADAHRGGTLDEWVNQVADAVFTPADRDDGFTLLAVGRPADSSGKMLALTEPER